MTTYQSKNKDANVSACPKIQNNFHEKISLATCITGGLGDGESDHFGFENYEILEKLPEFFRCLYGHVCVHYFR